MAVPILMPKLGNTVESCIIMAWKKQVGDHVLAGDLLCQVETDKATLEVECTDGGTILAFFFEEGDDVPVLTPIAAVGQPGEPTDHLRPPAKELAEPTEEEPRPAPPAPTAYSSVGPAAVSPRARKLAAADGIDTSKVTGSGPGGRVIERDVAAARHRQRLTPVAQRMLSEGGYTAPDRGSGPAGQIRAADLILSSAVEEDVKRQPLSNMRKLIARRMWDSLQTTAQLTLNSSADARAILDYRRQLKESPESLSLKGVTLNDMLLFAVARTLPAFPELNALFDGEIITVFRQVHLSFAVDSPRGLMVPLIRSANSLSLKGISAESARLAAACQQGRVAPDDLDGGTFTVSNLGGLGVESFTPILNPPQVGILGVGSINLKPVALGGEVQFIPHIGLSLTINHQVVDGAPAARFLQALCRNLAEFELLLAS